MDRSIILSEHLFSYKDVLLRDYIIIIIILYHYIASVTIETVLLYSNFIMYKALATV